MTEVTITFTEEIDRNRSIRVLLRLLFHAVFCGYSNIIFSYGIYLWVGVTRTELTGERIETAKMFMACYITNWNFVSISLLILASALSVPLHPPILSFVFL